METETTKEQPKVVQKDSLVVKIFAAMGVVFLVLLIVAFFSMIFSRMEHRNLAITQSRPIQSIGMPGRRGGFGGGTRFSGAANEQRLSGVVTAVTSLNITIAGGGTTNTVQTTSSTQYDQGTKPVVNDTVTVFGTTSSNTFTATEIAVQ